MKKLFLTFCILFSFTNSVFAIDINVYYYWRNPRCATCKKMENYTISTVQNLKDKTIHFYSLDMSKPENKKAVKKYGLYTKTVIISKTQNGKENWKNLTKIWDKVRNEEDFKNYIRSEIKQFEEGD